MGRADLPIPTPARDHRSMRVDIGPVPLTSAEAWLDYAAGVVRELRVAPRAVTSDVIDAFTSYLDEWRATAVHASASGEKVFRWSGDANPENVEYLVFALYRLGTRLTEEEDIGTREPRPAAATKFHVVLVRSLLAALECQGEAEAHFVRQLREVWGPAREHT
jgi:hypothetical protein